MIMYMMRGHVRPLPYACIQAGPHPNALGASSPLASFPSFLSLYVASYAIVYACASLSTCPSPARSCKDCEFREFKGRSTLCCPKQGCSKYYSRAELSTVSAADQLYERDKRERHRLADM